MFLSVANCAAGLGEVAVVDAGLDGIKLLVQRTEEVRHRGVVRLFGIALEHLEPLLAVLEELTELLLGGAVARHDLVDAGADFGDAGREHVAHAARYAPRLCVDIDFDVIVKVGLVAVAAGDGEAAQCDGGGGSRSNEAAAEKIGFGRCFSHGGCGRFQHVACNPYAITAPVASGA